LENIKKTLDIFKKIFYILNIEVEKINPSNRAKTLIAKKKFFKKQLFKNRVATKFRQRKTSAKNNNRILTV